MIPAHPAQAPKDQGHFLRNLVFALSFLKADCSIIPCQI